MATPAELEAMLLARLFEPELEFGRRKPPLARGDIGVAPPPRQPRRGLFDPQPFPGARAGFAEEWRGQPEDDSPSDRPQPKFAGEQGPMPPVLGPPPAAPDAGPGGAVMQHVFDAPAPERETMQMLGKWPLRQMAGRLGAAQDNEGNAKLAEMIAAKKNPQDFGPEGMRPDMARMISAPMPQKPAPEKPAGWLEMRAKHLGGAAPPPNGDLFTHDENAKVLADIHEENMNKAVHDMTPVERIKKGWLNHGLDDAHAQARADQWAATMAANDVKERAHFDAIPEAHARLAEHQLARDDPAKWSLWKMMQQQGGAGGDGEGGGMDADAWLRLAALNQQQGFPEGAQKALHAAQIKQQEAQGIGQQAVADLAHFREESNKYEMRKEQHAIELAKMQEQIRARLTKGEYKPSDKAIEEEIKRNNPELLIKPVPPIAPMARGRRGAVPPAPPVLGPPPAAPPAVAGKPPPPPAVNITQKSDTMRQKFDVTPAEKYSNLIVDNLDSLSGMSEGELQHVATAPGFEASLKAVKKLPEEDIVGWFKRAFGNKATSQFFMRQAYGKIDKLASRLGYKW